MQNITVKSGIRTSIEMVIYQTQTLYIEISHAILVRSYVILASMQLIQQCVYVRPCNNRWVRRLLQVPHVISLQTFFNVVLK